MKLLIAVSLTVVLLSAACNGDGPVDIHGPFATGAGSALPLELNGVGAEELKELLVGAVTEYLTRLDSSWERSATETARSLYQWLSNYSKHFTYLLPQVTPESTTLFDTFLQGMVNITNSVLAVFPEDRRQTVGAKVHSEPQATHQQPRVFYPTDQMFLNASSLIEAELVDLRNWITAVYNLGFEEVLGQLPSIQQSIRERHLYPNVRSLQHYVTSLKESHEQTISEHSTPALWEEYVAVREQLFALEIPA